MTEDVERLEMWRRQSEEGGKAGEDGASPAVASLRAQVSHLEASLEKQRQREAETAAVAKEAQSRMEDAALEATTAMQVRAHGGPVPQAWFCACNPSVLAVRVGGGNRVGCGGRKQCAASRGFTAGTAGAS